MKNKFLKLFCLCLFGYLSGCMPIQKYSWNAYDETVYDYYKNPNERATYVEALQEIIKLSEESGKIPPGIYAEYGYVNYETGNYKEAIKYFQKEHDTWAESRFFMNKMIQNAKNLENNKPDSNNQPNS